MNEPKIGDRICYSGNDVVGHCTGTVREIFKDTFGEQLAVVEVDLPLPKPFPFPPDNYDHKYYFAPKVANLQLLD